MRRTEVIEQIKDIIRHVAPTAKTNYMVLKRGMRHAVTVILIYSSCLMERK